jgi:Tol biopolymer transport system component
MRWFFLTAALVSLVIAGCSDDDNGGATSSVTAPAATADAASPTQEPPQSRPIVYEASDRSSTNVWVVDADTAATTQLTFDEGDSGHPAWAPDYSRIIYSSNRGGTVRRNLYTIKLDGSDVQRLTESNAADHWAPKYSPDMTQITFVEVVPAEGSYLVLMNADGTEQRRITGRYRFAEFPAWTRDGREIYFAAIEEGRNNIDIYAVDLESEEVRVIVQTDASDVCPHFTRDGQILTYASAAPGEPENTDLFARSLPFDGHTDLGDDVRLTDDPAFDDYSNTSPDDQTFVFLSRRDGNTELYLMDRDGGNERRLTFTPDLHENVPDW